MADLEKYNWQEQTFELKAGISLYERIAGDIPVDGRPYVLVVNGERLYMGKFWTMLFSLFHIVQVLQVGPSFT
ncbi:MAG: hypothetical protein LBS62_06680 [Clostridiales bacterium]|nr:hypothetical protein [Clostridiales bacterium]